jgi:hypothetical protein
MQTHTLAGQGLKVITWIQFMSTKKLIHFLWEAHQHTQDILNECSVFPIQRNCYHLFSEQQLSGTPENVENHEALRKDIDFCNDSVRDKTVHLSFMEQNTYSRGTQGCSSKWLWGFNLISTISEWQIEQEISHTHAHTHTHTHTSTQNDHVLIVI